MMALANLLHHPEIGEQLIGDTEDKRSNEDLGRVIALAHLAAAREARMDNDELQAWPRVMAAALREKFGEHARELAARAGAGIIASEQPRGSAPGLGYHQSQPARGPKCR